MSYGFPYYDRAAERRGSIKSALIAILCGVSGFLGGAIVGGYEAARLVLALVLGV